MFEDNTNWKSVSRLGFGFGFALVAGLVSAPGQTVGTVGTGWKPWGQGISYNNQLTANNVMGGGTQKLNANLNVAFFKSTGIDGFDYYLVAGGDSHSVETYRSWNADTVKGWFGDTLGVRLRGLTATGAPVQLVEAQPTSTTFTTSQTFSLGFNISSAPEIGGSLGYSNTVTAPDVIVKTIADSQGVFFDVQLPSVGYLNHLMTTPIPWNPYPASKAGTMLPFAAIYKVPKGAGLSLNVSNSAVWRVWAWGGLTNPTALSQRFGNVVVDFSGRQIWDGSGRCLTDQGGVVAFNACTSTTDQKWDYTQTSQIKNSATGRCLDFSGDAVAGKEVIMSICDEEPVSQKWAIRSTPTSLTMNTIQSISGFVAAPDESKASSSTVPLKLAAGTVVSMVTLH